LLIILINAQIVIANKKGNTLKQINISGHNKCTVNIDASILSTGTCNYFIADGKMIGSKQMVFVK